MMLSFQTLGQAIRTLGDKDLGPVSMTTAGGCAVLIFMDLRGNIVWLKSTSFGYDCMMEGGAKPYDFG